MGTYTYEGSLDQAYKVNWRIKDVLESCDFDLHRPWLPAALSGGGVYCLSLDEKRLLTQVELGAYAHLFGFLESFIAPQMANLARDSEFENLAAFEALTNFAAEEVKHIHLFREIRKRVDEKLGLRLDLVGEENEIANTLLTKSRGAVLLLTAAIEWSTQHHFVSAMKDSEELDPGIKKIFQYHWMEEAQHAQLDHLETVRVFKGMSEADRDQAVEDLIWLFAVVDGLLQQQVRHDLLNFSRYLGYAFPGGERQELYKSLLRAKRHCFIECGVTHPNFQEVLRTVATGEQQSRVQIAIGLLLQKTPVR